MKTKKLSTILITILVVIVEYGGCKQSVAQDNNFIVIDVMKNYPSKKLILQDFMDVEYIPLETNDNFICQGMVLAVGKKIILIKNKIKDGDIFIFNRNGKGLNKINRMGNGNEEYTNISGITLDEDKNEIFVNDFLARKILVYDLLGKFKRSFKHKDEASYLYIYNYDDRNLICNDNSFHLEGERNKQSFFIISKEDGNIIKKIEISFKKEKTPTLTFILDNKRANSITPRNFPIIPYNNNWIFMIPSSDTIFKYSTLNHKVNPFIIRTPSIQSMDPEVFLFPGILTQKYYFLETVKKEYKINTQTDFPRKKLLYDVIKKSIYEYIVYNNDYNGRIENMSTKTINNEIYFWDKIEPDILIQANKKGEIKGRLKEIAENLEEDSNPIIMLVKHKKQQ